MNPLFPDEPKSQDGRDQDGYALPRGDGQRIEPVHHGAHGADPAVELIRRKIDALYGSEPDATDEAAEVEQVPHRSKHQQFMHELSGSGKSLAEIQTAWHAYYAKLPDEEKRAVWQEFYAANARPSTSAYTRYVQQHTARTDRPSRQPAAVQQEAPQPITPAAAAPSYAASGAQLLAPSGHTVANHVVVSDHEPNAMPKSDNRSITALKREALRHVRERSRAQIKAKQHLQSLAFGLGVGAFVVLIFLFGFFNEVIIAPFIQPGQHAAATPIILNQDSVAPTNTPEVIIPKLNVELPNIYAGSVNENDIENELQDGVVHYPNTSVPGQQGNAAFFGHSSNNIFNKGRYKFAFVLLHELVPGDIFYLTYNGKVYTYRVFQKQIVQPADTWVLNPVQGKTATATLITCDPPGTSLHRLVVWGEQISPDPTANQNAPAPAAASAQPAQLASNGPTLWSRFWHWATPW